ncbi:unnamed protein product [Scytosiphon promiscuus]
MSDHHHSTNMSSAGDTAVDAASVASSSSSDDNRIKVVCRVRPPVSRETHGSKTLANRCVAVADDMCTVTLNSKPQEKNFTFDYAAGEDSTQEELFEEVGKPVTEACLEGYNGTIFCYGQTGSGKTFTTFGPGAVMENHLNPTDPKSYALRGLVPRVLEYLYANIARQVDKGGGKVSYSCKCSFYEIFNEKVFDLVDESNRDNPMGLTVREDTRKGVYVEGLMEEKVDGVDSACEILHRGFRNRHVGETAMNRESSRSHAVFTLVIQATEVVEEEGLTRSRVARFNLVDLAGSERQKDTQASGERLKEASNINKSLSTLGQVINALVEKSAGRFRHVHYRDSKLTFLLRDSLGGNSKTMLVAALSPADQNFGETLSTLKFAQRAKMIKNQAVKNEDTSGSFDALKRELTTLRQKLAAAQQAGGGSGGGGGGDIPRAIAAADGQCQENSSTSGEGGTVTNSVDVGASEALLANALRRARSAEEAQVGARRRVESLLAAAEKSEKDALQLKMIIKFRDGTIAAQRKKDADQERSAMADENAYLLKQLEGGNNESAEVSKWRLQFKEAEARLAELTGDKSGDGKRLVWGLADEERFRGELDGKVLGLMEENRELTQAADAFEERLHDETRRAEKRRLSAANRAELEAKKIVENALLSKLQEAQGKVEEKEAALARVEDRAACLETEKARQEAAVSALTKQLQDAIKREAEAVRDRDVRLADLQSKVEELSQAKERAVTDGGSELASLEVKIVGFIKDNSELLRANKELEEEADALDLNLEQLEAEKRKVEDKAAVDKADAKAAIESLEIRMQQQEDAHEREFEEQQAEKRSVARDLEAVTERLRSAEVAHAKEVEEHQRRGSDLQERLVETRELKEQLEARLKQLQDDYDTLLDQAHFSQSRVEEVEAALHRTTEDLCLVEEGLADAELRAEGQEFFKLAQEAVSARAKEECAERDERIEGLEEELEAAQGYAEGLRALLAAREQQEEEEKEVIGCGWAVEKAAEVDEVEAKARKAMAADALVCGEMIGEYERAAARADQLEQTVEELIGDEDRLVEEVYGFQHRIRELEADTEWMTSELTSMSGEVQAARAELDHATKQQAIASKTLSEQNTINSGLRDDVAAARATVLDLEAAKEEARARIKQIESERKEQSEKLAEVRDSCFEYQARAVTAEESIGTLRGEVARYEEDAQGFSAREEAMIAVMEVNKKAALAKDKEVEAKQGELDAFRASLAAKSEELAALGEEFQEVQVEASNTVERLDRAEERVREETVRAQDAEEEVAVAKGTIQGLEKELESLEEKVKNVNTELAASTEKLAGYKEGVASVGRELADAENKLKAAESALEAAKTGAEIAARKEGELRRAVAESEAERELEVAAAKAEVKDAKEELQAAKSELKVAKGELKEAKKELEEGKGDLKEAEEELEEAKEKLEDAKGQLKEGKEELAEVEQRLSVEMAKLKASESGAKQAEALKTKAEELAASLNKEMGELREEGRSAADRLEESEAVQRVHAGRVIDLKKEVERLQGSTMSEGERERLELEVESARLDVARMEREVEVTTSRNADLDVEIRAMRGETEGYTAKVMELKDVNASLVGHKNTRQKIQQVQKLKDENNLLSRKVKELDDRLYNIKRSGCGPGCGRTTSSVAATSREGDGSTGSTTSSWAGSQQSVSPIAQRSRNGGTGENKVGSAAKTYNLRRRPKTVEGAGASGTGADGVSTRGRRLGLRDMTNAS